LEILKLGLKHCPAAAVAVGGGGGDGEGEGGQPLVVALLNLNRTNNSNSNSNIQALELLLSQPPPFNVNTPLPPSNNTTLLALAIMSDLPLAHIDSLISSGADLDTCYTVPVDSYNTRSHGAVKIAQKIGRSVEAVDHLKVTHGAGGRFRFGYGFVERRTSGYLRRVVLTSLACGWRAVGGGGDKKKRGGKFTPLWSDIFWRVAGDEFDDDENKRQRARLNITNFSDNPILRIVLSYVGVSRSELALADEKELPDYVLKIFSEMNFNPIRTVGTSTSNQVVAAENGADWTPTEDYLLRCVVETCPR